MRRYFKYIFLTLITVIFVVSCIEEMESPQPMPQSDALTLVPRVKSFTNQYVTKANYVGNETKITSLTALIFNKAGNLALIQEVSDLDGITSISLSKSMLMNPQYGDLSKATIVIFANISVDNITDKDGNSIRKNTAEVTLETLNNYSCRFTESETFVTNIENNPNFHGFPMIGRTDNQVINLTINSALSDIEINLKILYAKVNFSISVANGTENNGTGMSFKLDKYSVHNVAMETKVTDPAGPTESSIYAYTATSSGTDNIVNLNQTAIIEDGSSVDFTFYVAESRYALAEGVTLSGIYPQDDWANDNSPYAHLRQQYKPKIVEEKEGRPGNGLATYVLLNGVYKDYRGQYWTVNYKVYLGKDNYSNFQVDRNSVYTNFITIKGIRNNDNYTGIDEEGNPINYIWIDHRVDVSDTGDAVSNIGITRETLIDSHIEVRPLRVKWSDGKYTNARIYLPTDNTTESLINWIGIERFTGTNCQDISLYCHDGARSTGKRRYFTTNLISELQSARGEFGVQTTNDGTNRKYINLTNGDCAWIYIDENVSSNGNTPASERTANITLEFYTDSDNFKTEVYSIKQQGLKVIGGNYIESYEEYLHSYDSDDTYTLTTSPIDYTQTGLAWGLSDIKLSRDYIVSAAPIYEIPLLFTTVEPKNYITWRYDYFHDNDAPSGDTYYKYIKNGNTWGASSGRTGLHFTDHAASVSEIKIIDMGTIPENAYQYCLSKNKFQINSDGNTSLIIHWYLPDVYELQEILASSSTTDLDTDAKYWSSQPSSTGFNGNDVPYIGQYLNNLSLRDEDAANARSVSASEITSMPRSTKNRIRCFYSSTGREVADMSERTPDGVGGNYSFHMKAYNNGNKAFFYDTFNQNQKRTYEQKGTDDFDKSNVSYTIPTFNFPGSNNPFAYSDKLQADGDLDNEFFSGFLKNPTAPSNWQPDGNGYYSILNTFKGLSEFELEEYKNGWGQGQGVWRETEVYKEDIQIDSTINKRELAKDVSSDNPSNLNLLFNIQFNKNSNTANSPLYYYQDYDNNKVSLTTTTTKRWKVIYNEQNYTPKRLSDRYTHTVSNISVTERTLAWNENAKNTALNTARTDAETQAIDAAKKEYPGRKDYYIDPDYDNINVSGSWNKPGTRYTAKATGTVVIICESKAEPSVYYEDASEDSGWYVYKTEPKYSSGIIADELRIYSGNSFTISLNETYQKDYEIIKVKVYYSGYSDIGSDGGFIGMGETEYYARFIESSLGLDHNKQDIEGMQYPAERPDGSGSQQWSGAGKSSVTMVLADFIIDPGVFGTSYKYQAASANPSKYLIVDRLEIQCRRKDAVAQ